LLRNADTAKYAAKANRERLAIFRPRMGEEAVLDLRNALLGAIERRELVLHYQPLFNIADQRVIGAQALLRWNRPGHGLVPPRQFLPTAKAVGQMPVIDTWVMTQAIATRGRWHRAGSCRAGSCRSTR
jgi:EAL domain-containing protein (putative c-di-GMP-specific phosphodiesterase class I)